MKRQLIILAAMACIMSTTVTARQLSPEEALSRVQKTKEMPLIHTMETASAPRLALTMSDDDMATVYVFTRQNDGGYLVVSADDAAGAALLGYADSGTFDASDMPDNVSWWLGQYSREIASVARSQKSVVGRSGDDDFDVPYVDPIAPICQTTWNQEGPYNKYCPVVSGKRCPTGCVATAMAQAMKVYNWPEKGKGSHTYRPASLTDFLTVNFADSTYQWDKMLNHYTTTSPAENSDAVASLMYSCGVSISMQYHPNSSGGNYTNAAKALVNYFDYDKSLRVIGRDYYGIAEWFDMIITELQAGHPVLYSGKNESAGHAFVCDGYSHDGYFHINWGWGGTSNGYFLLTALEPEQQGVGGSSAGYNTGQQIVIGLKKPEAGSTIVPVMQFSSNFTSASKAYPRGANTQVKIGDRRGIFNESIGEVKATMGVKLTDAEGNVSYIESTTPDKDYLSGQGFMYYYVMAQNFPGEGTYSVAPAVKDENGKWFDCEVKLSNERSMNLAVTKDSLVFTPTSDPAAKATEVELLSPIYPGRQCGIRARVTNTTDLEFYEQVTPILVQDHTDKATATPIEIELLPGESRVFEWVGDFPSTTETGDYLLYLVDSNNKDLNDGLAVTVEPAPTEALSVEVTSTDTAGNVSTEAEPLRMSYADFKVDVHVKCLAGYFTGIVDGGVFPLTGSVGVKAISGGYLAVRAGEEGSITLEDDLTGWLSENSVYYFIASSTTTGKFGNKLYFTYSDTEGMNVIGQENDRLRVSHISGTDVAAVEAPAEIVAIDLYSTSGMHLSALRHVGSRTVDVALTDCPAGVCLMKVSMADGTSGVVKIVK